MRGGALAPFIWSVLLAVLAAINAIWTTGNAIQGGMFAFAIVMIWIVGLALFRLAPEEALHKGEPKPRLRPELIPSASLASMMVGLSLGMFAFGWAFGHFFVFVGAGLLIASLGRLVIEHRASRSAHRKVLQSMSAQRLVAPEQIEQTRKESGERIEEQAKRQAQRRVEPQGPERGEPQGAERVEPRPEESEP